MKYSFRFYYCYYLHESKQWGTSSLTFYICHKATLSVKAIKCTRSVWLYTWLAVANGCLNKMAESTIGSPGHWGHLALCPLGIGGSGHMNRHLQGIWMHETLIHLNWLHYALIVRVTIMRDVYCLKIISIGSKFKKIIKIARNFSVLS